MLATKKVLCALNADLLAIRMSRYQGMERKAMKRNRLRQSDLHHDITRDFCYDIEREQDSEAVIILQADEVKI